MSLPLLLRSAGTPEDDSSWRHRLIADYARQCYSTADCLCLGHEYGGIAHPTMWGKVIVASRS